MPIYEFYCADCNTLFNFFSRRINTEKRPNCPQCGKRQLEKMLSTFATPGKAKEDEKKDPFAGMDAAQMEQAFAGLMHEAEQVHEEDPRQMAGLMRRFTEKTGLHLGERLEEALSRMEAGEDPDQVESEMGDLLDDDDALHLKAMKKKMKTGLRQPVYDDKLYEL